MVLVRQFKLNFRWLTVLLIIETLGALLILILVRDLVHHLKLIITMLNFLLPVLPISIVTEHEYLAQRCQHHGVGETAANLLDALLISLNLVVLSTYCIAL